MGKTFQREDAKNAKKDLPTCLHMNIERIAAIIIDAAMKVHMLLGPGLLESAYKACLVYELRKRGLMVETEVSVPIVYDRLKLDSGYRIDVLVEGCVVIELKSVERILPVHDAQLLSHLRLSGHKLGFRINFNVVLLKDGIRRIVNQL